ncbi:unnamed protein product [Durusdinium trenchii]|uniref:Uncharacterized protein n=1 Tax=Durusdinium trenchii TaxID=1381693 RepID=A0ABP0PFW2_9DINO
MAEVERSESNGSLDSARSSADEEPQQVEVEVGKFAEILEGQKWVRSLLYKSEPGKDHFTAWGEAKMVGVISIKAMALNHQALELAALWWCPLFDFPQCIPVQVMRQEEPRLERFFSILAEHWGIPEQASEAVALDPDVPAGQVVERVEESKAVEPVVKNQAGEPVKGQVLETVESSLERDEVGEGHVTPGKQTLVDGYEGGDSAAPTAAPQIEIVDSPELVVKGSAVESPDSQLEEWKKKILYGSTPPAENFRSSSDPIEEAVRKRVEALRIELERRASNPPDLQPQAGIKSSALGGGNPDEVETLPFSPGPIQWTTPATSPAAPPSTTPEPVAKTALEQARGHEKPEKPIEHEPPSVGVATSKPKEPEESVVALATSEPKELEGSVVALAASEPKEPQESVVALAASEPKEPEESVVALAASEPKEPQESVVALAASEPKEPQESLVALAASEPKEPEESRGTSETKPELVKGEGVLPETGDSHLPGSATKSMPGDGKTAGEQFPSSPIGAEAFRADQQKLVGNMKGEDESKAEEEDEKENPPKKSRGRKIKEQEAGASKDEKTEKRARKKSDKQGDNKAGDGPDGDTPEAKAKVAKRTRKPAETEADPEKEKPNETEKGSKRKESTTEEPNSGKRARTGERITFAGRRPPQELYAKNRFDAMREVFQKEVAPKLKGKATTYTEAWCYQSLAKSKTF